MGGWLLAATDPGGLYELLDRGGVLAGLCIAIFLIVVGGMREWYYLRPAWRLMLDRIVERDKRIEEISEDRDAWREVAQGLAGTAEKAVDRARPPHRRSSGAGEAH